MARGHERDPLFSSDFALIDASIGIPIAPLAFPIKQGLQIARDGLGFISFAGISLPTLQQDTMTIREGNGGSVHAVATGKVEAGEVTLRQAVLPTGYDFFLWFYQGIYGRLGPRRNFYVLQMGKDKKTIRRTYYLGGCIPVSWQPCGDLDAGSGDVSLEELSLHASEIELDFADYSAA